MGFTAVVGSLIESVVADVVIDTVVESFITDIGTEFLTDTVLDIGLDSIADIGLDSIADIGLDGIYEQVGDFAGNADWFDLNFPGEITNITDLNLSSITDGFDINFDEFGDLEGAIKNNGPGAFDGITNSVTNFANNTINNITGSIPTSIDQVADRATAWAKNQVVGTVKNVAATAVNGVVSQIPGGRLIAGTVNSALNTATNSVFGTTGTSSGTGYNTRTINTRVTNNTATTVAFDPNYDEFGNLDAAIANNTTSSASNVGYVIRQNDEDGSWYVINDTTGDIAASGLTEYEAIITAQDQTVYDSGDSRAVVDANGNVSVRSLTSVNNNTVFPIAYDDDGNLMPGFQLDENNNPVFVGDLINTVIGDIDSTFSLRDVARQQQTIRDQRQNNAQSGDWRVRLRLAPNSNYLYNDPDCGPILWPLQQTDGVIFPYTPSIDTTYKANYQPYDLTHSNYRGYFYQNSYVDAVSVKGTFTAQSTDEANYLLAVIHFFRSVTKMFYGQDALRGSPPPLTYLSGLGDFQFNEHPCVVSQFSYQLPSDVNYIRAHSVVDNGYNLQSTRSRQTVAGNPFSQALARLANAGMTKGALDLTFGSGTLAVGDPTYVPTKMEISLTLLPMQSRSQVSQQFSVTEFANGNLLKGGFW